MHEQDSKIETRKSFWREDNELIIGGGIVVQLSLWQYLWYNYLNYLWLKTFTSMNIIQLKISEELEGSKSRNMRKASGNFIHVSLAQAGEDLSKEFITCETGASEA